MLWHLTTLPVPVYTPSCQSIPSLLLKMKSNPGMQLVPKWMIIPLENFFTKKEKKDPLLISKPRIFQGSPSNMRIDQPFSLGFNLKEKKDRIKP